MSSRRSLSAVALLTAAVVGLSGCATTSGAGNTAQAVGEPVTGGTLHFVEPRPYDNFRIENSLWASSQIINNIADRLTWQDPDTGDIEPWIAESWEISDDGRTYTFHLRDDVTHSDGTPLDAENVKRNYDQFGLGDEEKGIAQHRYFAGYESSEVIDDLTFAVHLSEPNAGFLQVTSTYLTGLVSNATLELNVDEQGLIENISASGPFVFGDYEDDLSEVTLVAREDYDWAPESAEHQGRAYLDEVVFQVVEEDSVRTGLVQSGDADVARAVQPDDEELLASYGIEFLYKAVLGDVNGLYVNVTQPLTEEKEIRQALQAATDREEIRDTIYNENYGVARSVLASADPYFTDLYDEYLAYDPDRAVELIEGAGFELADDGYYVRDGERLEFTIYAPETYPRSKQTLELLSQQWKKVGVLLNVAQADSGTVAQASETAPLRQGQNSRADIDFLRTQYSSTGSNVNRVAEGGGAELDALLNAQATATSTEERQDYATQIQEYLLEETLRIPLYEETQVFAVNPRVQGFTTEAVTRSWFYDTWLSDEG